MNNALDIIKNGRFTYQFNWNMEITASEAEALVRSIKDRGANTLMLNHHHFRWSYVDLFADIEKATRIITDACHEHGLLVIEHHSSTATMGDHIYKGKKPADWANRDVRTGEIGYVPIVHGGEFFPAWWNCINNTEWQECYYDYISNFFAVTGVDGLQHDDIHFAPGWLHCGCEYCREKFHRLFGYPLPKGVDNPAWENFDSQVWRDWLMFRRISAGDEFVRIKDVIGPDKVLFGCCSVALNSTLGVHDAGYTYEDFARGANLLYEEAIFHPRNQATKAYTYNNYRRLFLDRKYYQAISEATAKPCVTYNYPQSEYEEQFCWMLSKLLGHGFISTGQFDTDFFKWDAGCGYSFPDPVSVANIGILHSANTLTYTGADSQFYLDELRGWAEAMTEENILFKIVLADTGFEAKALEGLNLLIMPNLSCISDKSLKIIQDYVHSGGKLILTCQSSLCDENGKTRDGFGLSELLQLKYRRTEKGIKLPIYPAAHKTDNYLMKNAGERVPYNGVQVICDAPSDLDRIYGWIEHYNCFSFNPPSPAIVTGDYGDGQFIYMSFTPGLMYSLEGTVSLITTDYSKPVVAQSAPAKPPLWIDERVPAHKTIMLNAIKSFVTEEDLPYTLVNPTDGIITNAFESNSKLVIGLLNVLGAQVKPGTQPDIKAMHHPIQEDITLIIRRKGIKDITLISPEIPEPKKLTFQQNLPEVTLKILASDFGMGMIVVAAL